MQRFFQNENIKFLKISNLQRTLYINDFLQKHGLDEAKFHFDDHENLKLRLTEIVLQCKGFIGFFRTESLKKMLYLTYVALNVDIPWLEL
jgi:hypothetical protein